MSYLELLFFVYSGDLINLLVRYSVTGPLYPLQMSVLFRSQVLGTEYFYQIGPDKNIHINYFQKDYV
jgi:hypothetical protein